MPVHLVGSKYLIQNLPPVAGINIAKQEGGDDVEEIQAQGRSPVLCKTSHLGERGDPTGVTPSTALQFTDPSRGNPMGGYGTRVGRF
jgi:hypothetical protein